ncbi:hypothetical protein [Polyangium aurulentum]|uniref:hypothetical protein n=1 Tax=Polyangium aurulentum TaxID=2567896 RepID=UPI00146E1820|nr:hypothetical protein [Polyangium aurulentum]UQA55080.1 hypothetical protein E8A73_027415 [Polyangium aurulentum]
MSNPSTFCPVLFDPGTPTTKVLMGLPVSARAALMSSLTLFGSSPSGHPFAS